MSIQDLINGLNFDGEPNQIESIIYCKDCMDEVKRNPDLIPRDYASIEAGFTDIGVQVWCTRHERSIFHLDVRGSAAEQELDY